LTVALIFLYYIFIRSQIEKAGRRGSRKPEGKKGVTSDHLTCTVEVDGDEDGTYEWDSGIMNWEDL
jgi:hypothetical protein